jgi:trk system potassium uptake protein TrkA
MGLKTSRQIIIVGGGRVGRRTAAQLAENGYIVTIIERDREKEELISSHPVNRVIIGDGTDVDVFQKANPATADVVAALTDDTEINLAVCELAQEMVPRAQTMLRIKKDGQQDYAHLGHVDNIVYPAAAGASVAASQIAGSGERAISTGRNR